MFKVRRGQTSKSKLLLAPVALSASTAYTEWFDRQDNPSYDEAEYAIMLGATSGTPSSFSVTCTVQTSADKSTINSAVDYAGSTLATTLDTAGTMARLHFSPNAQDRYFRLRYVTAFVSGSSPTVIGGVKLTLDGCQQIPAPSAAIATE